MKKPKNYKTENNKPLRERNRTKNNHQTSSINDEGSDFDFEVVPQAEDHIVDFESDTDLGEDNSDLDIFDSLVSVRPIDQKNAKDLSAFTTSPKVKSSIPKTSTALDIIISGNDENYMDDATFIASESQAANRKKKKSGGFQSMGLSPSVFNAIIHKGYKVPTPIQRKCIPLIMDGGDVVGMARTGSGKTAAFLIPMIEKLKAHSAKVGARAIVLSPSRELAMQTHKVVKELAKYTDLRSCLLVGGDNMEDQFSMIASNPDIIIATPGRLLHLVVEMDLDIGTVEYVVFDEADRLFEMGFSVQLHEILHRLPPTRQTLLFSATLPKLLVDFAKAGLQDPTLIRLDVDTKISRDLQMAFFSVKQIEKEAALLYILREIIKLPMQAAPQASKLDESGGKSKRKHQIPKLNDLPSYQTIIFTSTKHHVEYIGQLLQVAGYQVSYVYGALDQTARKMQIQNFRTGRTNILVVTDVAARGIDIPILSNVINYDFIDSSKVFVHRVGRAARAGRKGWAYSFITPDELPYLLDLQLFLARPLIIGPSKGTSTEPVSYVTDIVIGALHRDMLEDNMDWVKNKINESTELQGMQGVAINGYKHYVKSRSKASPESYVRAKEVMRDGGMWGRVHPLLDDESNNYPEQERNNLINSIASFRPSETIFEIGSRGTRKASEAGVLMRQRRQTIDKLIIKHKAKANQQGSDYDSADIYEEGKNANAEDGYSNSLADEALLEETFRTETKSSISKRKVDDAMDKIVSKKQKSTNYRDPDYYLSHYQNDANTERGYSMTQQGSFAEHAQAAQLDLIGDDRESQQRNSRSLRWDSRKKNFVRGNGIGADNKKLIKTESGTKISASFKSGRFNEWQQRSKVQLPRIGEQELPGSQRMIGGRKFRHIQQEAPKELHPLTIDYERKKSKRKREAITTGEEIPTKKGAGKKEYNSENTQSVGKKTKKMVKAGKRTVGGKGTRSELKNVDQIRKIRNLKEHRKQKNGRTSRKSKANGKHK